MSNNDDYWIELNETNQPWSMLMLFAAKNEGKLCVAEAKTKRNSF